MEGIFLVDILGTVVVPVSVVLPALGNGDLFVFDAVQTGGAEFLFNVLKGGEIFEVPFTAKVQKSVGIGSQTLQGRSLVSEGDEIGSGSLTANVEMRKGFVVRRKNHMGSTFPFNKYELVLSSFKYTTAKKICQCLQGQKREYPR